MMHKSKGSETIHHIIKLWVIDRFWPFLTILQLFNYIQFHSITHDQITIRRAQSLAHRHRYDVSTKCPLLPWYLYSTNMEPRLPRLYYLVLIFYFMVVLQPDLVINGYTPVTWETHVLNAYIDSRSSKNLRLSTWINLMCIRIIY